MISRFTLFLLVFCAITLHGQNEDCPLAFDLVDRETPLTLLPELRVESFQLTNAGIDEGITDLRCQQPLDFDIDDAIRLQIINADSPVTRADSLELEQLFDLIRVTNQDNTLPYQLPESRSFWFSFHVEQTGVPLILVQKRSFVALGVRFLVSMKRLLLQLVFLNQKTMLQQG